ncbi:MAG: hypothetical protein H7318_11825 [Oligoflexus sp.]|nr:hypothetical protein [Oligoflexus sp.]
MSQNSGAEREGYANEQAALYGSVLHGLFENASFRLRLVNQLLAKRSLPALAASKVPDQTEIFDRMADHLESNCDRPAIHLLVQQERK